MHNNGTTPQLILPADKKLLPDLKPEMGVELKATPRGVLMTSHIGAETLTVLLPVQQAAQLGVSLISVAALLQHAAMPSSVQVAVPETGGQGHS
jgi:hypothetical protein